MAAGRGRVGNTLPMAPGCTEPLGLPTLRRPEVCEAGRTVSGVPAVSLGTAWSSKERKDTHPEAFSGNLLPRRLGDPTVRALGAGWRGRVPAVGPF